MQIVPQDEGGNLGRRVAFLRVDECEQVECVGEHVAATNRGIDQADFFRFGKFQEVGLRFAFNVVGHVLAKPRGGPIQQPEPAKGVLD